MRDGKKKRDHPTREEIQRGVRPEGFSEVARYNAAMRRAQRRARSIDQLMLSYPDMTRAHAEQIVDQVLCEY